MKSSARSALAASALLLVLPQVVSAQAPVPGSADQPASAAVPVDAATRSRVIDGAIASLNARYVFPDVAKRMERALRSAQKRGELNSITDGQTLANALTDRLRAVSHDKHLGVTFSRTGFPNRPAPAAEDIAGFRAKLEQINCGFEKVEVLPGNVGYLKLDLFADPEICGPTAIAAMNFLGNSAMLIFDLRDNGGGDPKMVALVSTYLFTEPTHLNDIWDRTTGRTQQYWSLSYVPGKRLAQQPVFVLISSRTFSGGEEFSYNLKALKRATLVGETTGGGAHPVQPVRIDAHFEIGVPFARAINPYTKTNWEGSGVEPDVKVAAAEALSTAQRLAGEKRPSQ